MRNGVRTGRAGSWLAGVPTGNPALTRCFVVVVPKVGLEPTRPKTPHFECGASADSATWARKGASAGPVPGRTPPLYTSPSPGPVSQPHRETDQSRYGPSFSCFSGTGAPLSSRSPTRWARTMFVDPATPSGEPAVITIISSLVAMPLEIR